MLPFKFTNRSTEVDFPFHQSLENKTTAWKTSTISVFLTTIQNSSGDVSTMDDDKMIHSMQFNYDAKDTHIVHTLLKIQEMLNQNNLRATAETESKTLLHSRS